MTTISQRRINKNGQAKKDKIIVKYSVMDEHNKLFASKYKLYLPTEKELVETIELQRHYFEQHFVKFTINNVQFTIISLTIKQIQILQNILYLSDNKAVSKI